MQNTSSIFERSEIARITFLTLLSTLLIGIIATLVGIWAYNFIPFCGADAGMGFLICIPFGLLCLPPVLLLVARIAARPAKNFGFVRPLATMNVALLLMPSILSPLITLSFGVLPNIIFAGVMTLPASIAVSLLIARHIYTRIQGRRKQNICVAILFTAVVVANFVIPYLIPYDY